MTSFPVVNDNESKNPSVWLKILGWIITCINQICFIYFSLGSGITGLRPCFQFSNLKKSIKKDSNWTTKSWFINRVRRIRWASQRSQKILLHFPFDRNRQKSNFKLIIRLMINEILSVNQAFVNVKNQRKCSLIWSEAIN